MTAADLEVLRLLVRAELAAALAQRRAAPVDVALLVRAIAERWGSREFLAAEVGADPALAPLVPGLSPRAVGRLLSAAAGRDFDGLALRVYGQTRGGILYALERGE